MFTNKAIISLDDGLYRNRYRVFVKDFLTNENAALAVQTFS